MSVLRKPEVAAQYGKHYVAVHADFTDLELDDNDPRHAVVKRHNPQKLRPVLVFLDSQGKEVLRHRGRLNDAADALRLDRFIHEKHYLKTDWGKFRSGDG